MSEDYRCPRCLAVFSAQEARSARYRCPTCREQEGQPATYLIARRALVGPRLVVRQPIPMQKEDSSDSPVETSAKAPKRNDRSLIDHLEVALSTRRDEAEPPPLPNSPAPPDNSPSQPSAPPEADVPVALVLPPPRNEIDAAAMEQLAGTFARLPSPVALEIAGEHKQRQLMIRGKPEAIARIEAQLYSIYEQVDVQLLAPDKDPGCAIVSSGLKTAAAQLTLTGPEFLPLKTWREFEGNDPLRPLLGAFGALQEGEHLLSQLIIRGEAPEGWASPHLRQLAALKRRGYGADAPMPAKNILGWTAGLAFILIAGVLLLSAFVVRDWRALIAVPVGVGLAAIAIACLRLAHNPWRETLDEDAIAKLRDKAFQCELRLFVSARTEARATLLLDQLIAAYQVFDTTSGNHLRAAHFKNAPRPSQITLEAQTPSMLLNVKELAGFWHMPVGQSLELVRRQTYERLLPLPNDVIYSDGAFIGIARKGGRTIQVNLSIEALRGNMIFIGKTQHGKSTLMAHVALRWMRDTDRSVVIVDPHGDLARQIIGLVPPERLSDVIYLDLSDETRSAGLNLLDVSDGTQPHEVAETFMDVGKALWKDYWGPRMAIPLQFGLRALACANQRRPSERQYVILSLVSLLTADPEVREAFLRREVPLEDQPGLHQYFLGQYNLESQVQREQVISPVLSKAHAFERSPAILRLVGQPRSTLRLFETIRSRKILIVNTNSGVLGEDLAGFAGSLILNIMRRVIAQQTTLPREERVRVSVIADEFQIMTGADFGALLGELQKNGGNFVLGTQSLDSLTNIDETGALTGKIFAGVTTKAVFQVNGHDAHYLTKHELDCERLQPESLMNLPKYHAYLKTVNEEGRPIPVCSVEIAAIPEPDPRLKAAVRAHQAAYTVPADEADRLAETSLLRFSEEYSILTPKGEPVMQGEGETSVEDQMAARPVGERDTPFTDVVQPVQAPDSETQRSQKARPKAVPPDWKPSGEVGEKDAFGTALGQVIAMQARKQDGPAT